MSDVPLLVHPLPWKATPAPVQTTYPPFWSLVTDRGGDLSEEYDIFETGDEAMIKYAAKACNLYPELVAALRDMLPHVRRDIDRLNAQMVGNLYPAINDAALRRLEDLLRRTSDEPQDEGSVPGV